MTMNIDIRMSSIKVCKTLSKLNSFLDFNSKIYIFSSFDVTIQVCLDVGLVFYHQLKEA